MLEGVLPANNSTSVVARFNDSLRPRTNAGRGGRLKLGRGRDGRGTSMRPTSETNLGPDVASNDSLGNEQF